MELPATKVKAEKMAAQEVVPLKRSVRNNRNNNFKFGSATSRNGYNNNKKGEQLIPVKIFLLQVSLSL